MLVSLIDKLEQLQDFRRLEGKRHSISTILIIVILSILSHQTSLRSMAAFAKRNQDELVRILNLKKNRMPTLYVFRSVLPKIDFNELSQIIKEWIIENKLLDDSDWLSIDGKSIKSTISEYHSVNQNFVSIVTAFSHNSGIALLSAKYENKKISEIAVVADLISRLNLENRVLTLDALHTKKNS